MHYLLFYEGDADYVERRAPHRQAHVAHARAAVARGDLVLAGALAEPVDGSVFLFVGDTAAAAEQFAAADPYVVQGVVRRWWVRPWTTVVGAGAQVALPPGL